MKAIFDITQPLRKGMPNWPGDTEFSVDETWHMSDTCPVRVSKLTQSTHAGTHADAPSHYDPKGIAIDRVELIPYIGECQLVDVSDGKGPIMTSEILPSLDQDREGKIAPRILLKTYKTFPHKAWDSNFRPVDATVIPALASLGCTLIGTDTPSLDCEDCKQMYTHNAVKDWGLSILEGLVFDNVNPGHYELIALPLKIEGADAAPVRAILRGL